MNQGAEVDGQGPTFEAISGGSYPVSGPLYFCVNRAHADAVPGIREYLFEFTSEAAFGQDGCLNSDAGTGA